MPLSMKLVTESLINNDPFILFDKWYKEACHCGIAKPNAMCLATCNSEYQPRQTTVFLKGFDERGFVWHTSFETPTSKDLEFSKRASLTFWWGDLKRQIRIEGTVKKTLHIESDHYFAKRQKSSQIAAVAFNSSKPIKSRDELEKVYEEKKDQVAKMIIDRPKDKWGGYRLWPDYFEFWKERPMKMHDIISFKKISDPPYEYYDIADLKK